MAKVKRTGGASFLKKVSLTPGVKRVRARIKKHDVARKRLSRQYKAAVKVAARKLRRKK